MGNYEQLKQAVADVIKTNGNQEITGAILQNALLSIISTIGTNATFAGIATPTTNPGTPDQNVFYIATTVGSYSNFGNIEVSKGQSAILMRNNGTWVKNTFKPMTDFNSVFDSDGKSLTEFESGIIYDVSAHNDGAVFESLSALLSSSNLSTLIPTSVRHGGMSIRFIQSSDNKYVQCRLKTKDWSSSVSDWYKETTEDFLVYQTSNSKAFDIVTGEFYWDADDNTHVTTNYAPNYCHLKPISIKKGSKFYLKCKANYTNAWIVTDVNNVVLDKAATGEYYESEVTVNANDAAFLYINLGLTSEISDTNTVFIFDSYVYQQIKTINDRISGIEETKQLAHKISYQTSNIKLYDFAHTDKFWWDADDNVHVTTNYAPNYACLKPIPIKKGDKFYLKCYSAYTNAWIVTDVNNVVLDKATGVETFDDEVTVNADNAALLYINCGYNTRLSEMVFIFDSYVYQQIKTINETVEEIIIANSNIRRLFPHPSYAQLLETKCPNFYKHMKKKDKDVCVVLTGTSLTQGNRYTTERADASERPPLLGTNDLASALFDKMVNGWYGQKYRRYDHEDITYSEGTWETTNDLVVNDVHIWDDRLQFKNPWTKTTIDANAYVRFTIPNNAWQFNFIYKTDTTGGTCTVTIAEGDGKVEVWNGTAWVEANGYTFSMHEDEAQYSSESGLNTRGNTTYQKRLKMRCKNNTTGGINSIGETKVITISKGNDATRLNVVGFEWSPREFMFTFINGARGSHQWGMEYFNQTPPNLDSTNLEAWQDNDIWEFNPDLIISEVTLINYGASNVDSANYRKRQFEYYVRRAFFNEAVNIAADGAETQAPDGRSLAIKSNNWQNCEIMFYGSLMYGADNSMYDANGNFIPIKNSINAQLSRIKNNISGDSYGDVKFASDNYDWVDGYMKTKSNFIYIPTLWEFIKLAYKYYGNYKSAFVASGANGATLSYDGVHLNDNGAALWADMIAPVFDGL